MKHTAKTAGILVAIIVIAIVILMLATVLDDFKEYLLTVDPLNWIFFVAGVLVTLLASLIAAAINGRLFRRKLSNDVIIVDDDLD